MELILGLVIGRLIFDFAVWLLKIFKERRRKGPSVSMVHCHRCTTPLPCWDGSRFWSEHELAEAVRVKLRMACAECGNVIDLDSLEPTEQDDLAQARKDWADKMA